MTLIGNKDFYLEVAKGNVTNHLSVNIFGRNPDVDGAAEDLIATGGTLTPPTTARIHNIVSTSVNDTAAGTGARSVTVTGLDGSYVITTESVTLNGTTDVPTVNSYTFIHSIVVTSAGSGGVNAGTITATAVTDATVSNSIAIGYNASSLGAYMIPAGYTGYLVLFEGGLQNSTSGTTSDVFLYAKPFGEVYQLKGVHGLINTGSSKEADYYYTPLVLTEKSIVKMSATSSNVNSDVQGRINIILVAN